MDSVTILDSEGVRVVSLGNGLAYNVLFGSADNPPMRNLFFQGDDATALREAVEAAEEREPNRLSAHIWTDCALDAVGE